MNDTGKTGLFNSLLGQWRKPSGRAPLSLYIPISVKKLENEAIADIAIETVWSQVAAERLSPLLLLQEANRYLDKINPLPLPYEQRTRLTHILLNEVSTAIGALFSRFFHQGGGIPETREQRESISYAVHAAEQLALSYKLLFRQDWAAPARDPSAREKIVAGVLRILECVRLEQFLRAFRYQKLPQHAWRDCNQLFFALRGGPWDTAAKYPLKIRLTVEDDASRIELFPRVSSVEQLYLAIQLTGLMGVISWPVHLMYRVGGYLDDLQVPVAGRDDDGDTVPSGHIIVYRNQGMPPRFNRSLEQLGEAMLIDIEPIIRQVTRDRGASTSSAAIASATLRDIPERDRALFLDLLAHHLRPQRRRDVRQRVFDMRRVRVYGGFEAAYRLFRDIHCRDKNQTNIAEERRFWDELARHTSILAEGEGSVLESCWVIADESAGGIQLRQRERDYSMPLYVGRLVAYNGDGEDIAASRLGYVTRLQRFSDDEMEVAITRLRAASQAVVVEDIDTADRHILPALLLRDEGGKLRLLCDNKYKFITGEHLAVVNDTHHFTGTLGDIVLAQADFTVFDLHAAR
jgi:hypothetical protein